MPLKSAILNVRVTNPYYVRFPMDDGDKSVTVHIATSWIEERATRDHCKVTDLRLLFNLYRDEIEAAASEKYDRSYCDGADVVVVLRDLMPA